MPPHIKLLNLVAALTPLPLGIKCYSQDEHACASLFENLPGSEIILCKMHKHLQAE